MPDKRAILVISKTGGDVDAETELVTAAMLGGGGGASAANQLLQLTQEELTNTKIGEVQASPTANTLLGRLKDLYTAITGTLMVSGTVNVVNTILSNTYTTGDLTSTATTSTAIACEGVSQITLSLTLTTATTPPAIQLQGSDDEGTNYYNLGVPLTGVASSTVQTSISGVLPTHVRWKVSTAGNTIGAGWSINMRAM